MTVVEAPPTAPPVRTRRVSAWPVLVGALALALLCVAGSAFRWPAVIEVALFVAAAALTAWAAWVALRRPSLVIAPLAVCILALGNPATLAGMTANVEAHAGVITVRTQGGFGLVLWKQYPGVAGWTAPEHPEAVNTVAFASQVQAAVRTVVTSTSTTYGLTWSTGQQPSGASGLANGFGGASMFDRVDSAMWRTTTDDGAARVAIGVAARAAAAELGLGDENVVDGDPSTGDGTATWTNADGILTLTLDGADVALVYSGGPFLNGNSLPGEYEQRMQQFEGLTPPAPIDAPNLPQR